MVERFLGSDFAFPYADPLSTPRQRRRFSEQALTDRIRKQTMEQTPEGLRTSGIGAVTSVLAPIRAAAQVPTLVGSAITRASLPTSARAAIDAATKIKPSMATGFRSTVPGAVAPRVATGLIPKTASSMGPGAAQLAMLSMLGGDVPEQAPAPAPQVSAAMPTPTPAGKAAESVNEGARVATLQNQDRRESSFLDTLLGNVDVAGLLQVFARPEFLQPGQSFAQGFSRAAAARTAAQQAQEATEAKAQREQEELDIARQRAEAAMLTAQRGGTTPRALGITGPKVDEFKAAITSDPAFVDAITKFSQKGTTWLSRRFGEGIDEEGIKSRVALDAIAIQQRTGATPSVAIQEAINNLEGTPQKAETGGDPFANIGRR